MMLEFYFSRNTLLSITTIYPINIEVLIQVQQDALEALIEKYQIQGEHGNNWKKKEKYLFYRMFF